jgi:glucose-6-phosphate isomerase
MPEVHPWRPFRLADSEAQKRLEQLASTKKKVDVREAFSSDPTRLESLTEELPGLYLDLSKQRWDSEVKNALIALALEADVAGAIRDLFGGVRLNTTEDRAVLHMALRANAGDRFEVDGNDVLDGVMAVRARMLEFVDAVHERHACGEVTDIVNIGIGGSDLGPAMAARALRRFASGPECHFVSNVDGAHLEAVLSGLNPQTTMLVVVSKTFTTQETMANARLAKAWLEHGGGSVARQIAAVSTNLEATRAFGVDEAQTFGFENWVGGRYSMWGPVGLSIALSIGSQAFRHFLQGAREVDVHMRTAPLEHNIPVLLALLGHWNQNVLGFRSHVVIPYSEDLNRLPAYLQQADMESNGKFVGRDGRPVSWNTGAVVWGEPGTNSQHAFFQLLHQGTEVHPVDFIAFRRATSGFEEMHDMLLANALAQAEALLQGRPAPDGEPHRHFPGNRPSSFFLFDELNPQSLGMLVALHEHRIFVQGVLWGISSFDQWGVELGKAMANAILPELKRVQQDSGHDPSTQALINRLVRD